MASTLEEELRTVGDYVTQCARLAKDAFLSRFATPVLLHRPRGVESAAFHTLESAAAIAPPPSGLTLEHHVYCIKKRPDGPFGEQIGVGRTRAADIHLPYSDVSKYHAYFAHNADDQTWSLADAGSKNGTWLDGVRLEPREPSELADRAKLRFGKTEAAFCQPEAFYDLLKELSGL